MQVLTDHVVGNFGFNGVSKVLVVTAIIELFDLLLQVKDGLFSVELHNYFNPN